jgi:hypothetical protein
VRRDIYIKRAFVGLGNEQRMCVNLIQILRYACTIVYSSNMHI